MYRSALQSVQTIPTLVNSQFGVVYPTPTADPPDAETLPRPEFFAKLDRVEGTKLVEIDEGSERHGVYLARLGSSSTVVLVKFTPRYNGFAHRLLAAHESPLAPTPHHCLRVIGGLYMVVMEYISDASPLHAFLPPSTPPRPLNPQVVEKDLTKALQLPHKNNLVFGDLRQVNVLYSHKEDRVFLVDFDLVGKVERIDTLLASTLKRILV